MMPNDKAYLVYMVVLLELHRVLKPTGSLYLHCDHRLKMVLDAVFGQPQFQAHINWWCTRFGSSFRMGAKASCLA